MEMGVLTISRELGSSGDVIGKKIAEELNWSLLDNESFAAAALGQSDYRIPRDNAIAGVAAVEAMGRSVESNKPINLTP